MLIIVSSVFHTWDFDTLPPAFGIMGFRSNSQKIIHYKYILICIHPKSLTFLKAAFCVSPSNRAYSRWSETTK